MTFAIAQWRAWSLTRTLTLLLVLFSVVPVVLLTAYDHAVVQGNLITAARSRNLHRAQATVLAVEADLSDALEHVRLMAIDESTVQFVSAPGDQAEGRLITRRLEQVRALSRYDAVMVVGQNGTVIAASAPQLVSRSLVAARYFLTAIAGQIQVDEPRFVAEEGRVYIHVSCPVRATTGSIHGAVVGRVTMEVIDRILRADTNFASSGEFGVLWDGQGIRLAGSERLGQRFTPFAPLSPLTAEAMIAEHRFGPATASLLARPGLSPGLIARSKLLLYDATSDPFVQMDSANGRLHAAIVPLGMKRWLYGIFVAEPEILRATRAADLRSLAVAGFAVLIAMVAAAFSARAVLHPVRALARTADAVAAGDLARRTGVTQGGEMGRLAATFDSMVEAVAQKDAELRRHAEGLERIVEERTAALRASESELRALVGAMSDVIVTVEPGGRVLSMASTKAALGHTRLTQAVGRPLQEILSVDEAGEILEGLRRAHTTRQPTDVEVCFKGADCEGWYAVVFSPLENGNVLCIARDRTIRKQLEERLRQAHKMEAVGRLAGGIAHDFNNLLTAILGYTALLEERLGQDPSVASELAEIRRAGDSAAALTSQLLAFSRKQLLRPEVHDLNKIIGGIERMLRRVIGEDVRLVTTCQPELCLVTVDGNQLEQVILNLAVNARDAMPDGGVLTIETANAAVPDSAAVSRGGVPPGRYAKLMVTDTGHGIDPATMPQIFEPFFSTKPRDRGTGLGLATVHGIVTQSGGHITVESEPGAGATFSVYLPASDEALVPAEAAPGGSLRGNETVLLVEDDQAVRSLAARVLRRFGYEVLMAGGPDEALKLSETFARHIHAVVTDVVMPGMNGRELAARLIAQRGSLRVLYMSGYTDDGIARYGILDSSEAFLQKPFTTERLGRKLREVLDADSEPGASAASG